MRLLALITTEGQAMLLACNEGQAAPQSPDRSVGHMNPTDSEESLMGVRDAELRETLGSEGADGKQYQG